MSKLICLLFLLLLSIFSWSQNDTCVVLKKSEIVSIQIKKVNPKNSKLQRELYLTDKNITAFTDRWNTMSQDTTKEDPKPKYFFFVTLKNKNVLYFASSANQITDKKCRLASSDNGVYFDKLYDSLTE